MWWVKRKFVLFIGSKHLYIHNQDLIYLIAGEALVRETSFSCAEGPLTVLKELRVKVSKETVMLRRWG